MTALICIPPKKSSSSVWQTGKTKPIVLNSAEKVWGALLSENEPPAVQPGAESQVGVNLTSTNLLSVLSCLHFTFEWEKKLTEHFGRVFVPETNMYKFNPQAYTSQT